MNSKIKRVTSVIFCVVLLGVVWVLYGRGANLSGGSTPDTSNPSDSVSRPADKVKEKVPFLYDDKNDRWGGGPSGNARLYSHIHDFEIYLKKAAEELGAYDPSSKFVEKYNATKQENKKEYDAADNDRELLLKYKDKLERLMDEAVPELELYEKSGKTSEALKEFRSGISSR